MRAFAHPAVLGERTTPANLRHYSREASAARQCDFGAVEPPTKLAALHHHHIRMNVGLVARVEFSGRELVCTAGLSATTLADRFCISMSVISPKKSPAPCE
jgi:hypothetical protein